uniref:Uncharacterized protein n=1 Tax=Heterorhabditis bacteriophora TaxID=37862 RepID=A0A1I7WB57_HETBA
MITIMIIITRYNILLLFLIKL